MLIILLITHVVYVRFYGNPLICPATTTSPNPFCVQNYGILEYPYDTPQTREIPPNTCQTCKYILVGYRLKSPGFSVFDLYDEEFISYLSEGLNLTENQVVLQDYTWQVGPRLAMDIRLYPVGNITFNQSEFDRLYTAFSEWQMDDSTLFGPYELLSFTPRSLSGTYLLLFQTHLN